MLNYDTLEDSESLTFEVSSKVYKKWFFGFLKKHICYSFLFTPNSFYEQDSDSIDYVHLLNCQFSPSKNSQVKIMYTCEKDGSFKIGVVTYEAGVSTLLSKDFYICEKYESIFLCLTRDSVKLRCKKENGQVKWEDTLAMKKRGLWPLLSIEYPKIVSAASKDRVKRKLFLNGAKIVLA